MNDRYFLDKDYEGRWYAIPLKHKSSWDEWTAWCDATECQDPDSIPDYAHPLPKNGPRSITFEKWGLL